MKVTQKTLCRLRSVVAISRRRFPLIMCWAFLCVACSHRAGQSQNTASSQPAAQSPATAPEGPPALSDAASRAVQIHMHNVFIHLSDSVASQTDTLSGEVVPLGTNTIPNFDDPQSFVIRVRYAKIRVSPEVLSNVMNDYAFAKPDAPLKGVGVSIEGNRLRVKGRLHSKGDLPFETLGSLSATKDGRVRIHTEKVKAFHVPIKGIMSVFGIELANVINTSKIPGIDTDNDDLIMDMSKLMPPPAIVGTVTEVRVEPKEIVFTLGADDHAPILEQGNYMVLKGNRLRFGKLVMEDTDVVVIDLDPRDPLDWNQPKHIEQLTAGYCKVTHSLGLRTYVKDYNKLSKSSQN